MIPASRVASPLRALPFAMSYPLVPVAVIGAVQGGWTVLLLPVVTWYAVSLLDAALGVDSANADPDTEAAQLGWYRAIPMLWAPVQLGLLYWMIWYVTGPGDAHLSPAETVGLFFGVGVITGTIGITYAHELMHQPDRTERALADLLLAMVLYSHFRSEHLLVHHRYVGTPRDTVTARYGEGFHRFFPRVLCQSLVSAVAAERDRLARKGRPATDRANPFWRYAALQAGTLGLAAILGGWAGLGLFLWQALVAVWQLELVNYVEHYGLTRKHLGGGRYEHVKPRHSWNAAHKATNWLLINLQRHSDHHHKPARRFPLLQTHDEGAAPQLPCGYPVMTMAALVPPLWRRIMDPRVRRWRKTYYPEITDWRPYTTATTPPPR